MAFYDDRAPRRVACRAYLVTAEQFADVAAQEMRRPPGGEFALELARVLADVDPVHALGPGRYETLTRVGTLADAPMVTVTYADVATLGPVAPSAAYLRCISRGLHEAHGWDPVRTAGYLAGWPGVDGAWTPEELASVAGRAPT